MSKKITQKALRKGVALYPYCPEKRQNILQNIASVITNGSVIDVIPISGGKCKSALKKYYWRYKYRDQHIKDTHQNGVCMATKCPIADITKIVEALIKRHLKKCAECSDFYKALI